ncbi:DNA alkylation repair protein [Schaalia sp. 19OD2882]|uniref:DNA alkylation repair protein n=1 Tax=Schaalia sp. 19OD2882 TaxID=2794089 RepID=UPI001C1EC971|nr:DNA alkylation repair protein [Schaalia sp. 19OD2882]QWW19588.1 DNA alkylation repair protein [Schaalia sp. 19OD2882]
MLDVDHLADADNAAFLARLVPTIDPARIKGARNPALREIAKRAWRDRREEALAFLDALPHATLDEDLLHSFLIAQERDLDTVYMRIDAFLPYVDNWASCDSLSPKALAKDPERLEVSIRRWIGPDSAVYTRRFAVCMLMEHFLREHFRPEFHALVAGIESDEYYLHMVQGWYFATALAHQPEETLPWLVEGRLPPAARRKAIQKSLESLRIPDTTKDLLRQVRAGLPRQFRRVRAPCPLHPRCTGEPRMNALGPVRHQEVSAGSAGPG